MMSMWMSFNTTTSLSARAVSYTMLPKMAPVSVEETLMLALQQRGCCSAGCLWFVRDIAGIGAGALSQSCPWYICIELLLMALLSTEKIFMLVLQHMSCCWKGCRDCVQSCQKMVLAEP